MPNKVIDSILDPDPTGASRHPRLPSDQLAGRSTGHLTGGKAAWHSHRILHRVLTHRQSVGLSNGDEQDLGRARESGLST
jgi:hypothetical protein